jgi:hypothetical protein
MVDHALTLHGSDAAGTGWYPYARTDAWRFR